ncbi:protein of unknown function [Taphrina deformans PYCC 5710]|uniref:C2H2-type domain-containing protein n=1 Tax=Taphrina deformans (strain PYCC 5710 / ATCC 11124 / CBS 356.35 / IMI 108563 / JCM 9778 / NBRC 8474) TaxID=1097556 RepID=R4XGD6_TAPDE|nr:protein of unknown function [Taphrina deformans PYCC 5710]|eukprot:CCG84826.1 protein of unknown function [Taphrina deformans PYCC 5710]
MNNPTKRQSLQSERSFDSSTGRPTKYFKLDRTYSDVVEDELYDPQIGTPNAPVATADKNPQSRTERIQNVYPQLFDTPIPQNPESNQRSEHYWPGMESGIRFDREQRSDLRTNSPVIADKKQKMQQQPEQSTVSPKEAFLDYPDSANFRPKESVFDSASKGQSKPSDIIAPPKHERVTANRSSQHYYGEMTTPKTITPVRANEKLSPKPVFRGQSRQAMQVPMSLGPSEAQANNNAAANAKIRALYKEESTTSNMSANSEPQTTPPSINGSEPDYISHIPSRSSPRAPEIYTCNECYETFDRAAALDLHARIHARPPPPVNEHKKIGMKHAEFVPHDQDADNDDDDNDDDDDDDGDDGKDENDDDEDVGLTDNHVTDKSKNKSGGPHRCDWVIPSTGQVCGTVFSRPYDLVRHQDTIHRAKKLEFRCEICIAAGTNKIFSRNDALVRHMRHVHKKDPPKRS